MTGLVYWLAELTGRTRALRPRAFPMPPAPVRGMALEAISQLVEELLTHGAVDGATPDALDPLIEAWLAQWRAQLAPEFTSRQAGLQRLIGAAEARVAAAGYRAAATQLAHDNACAAYAIAAHEDTAAATATAAATTAATTASSSIRQETNGVRTHPLH